MSNDRVTQVVSALEQQILSGKLAPGDLLPPEREICVQLGVSRSVVREALGRLASVGLVKSHHGSGTRVAAPTSKTLTAGFERMLKVGAFSLEDLSVVRLPLETTIVRLAALHRNQAHLLKLEKWQKVLGNPRRSLESHVEADLEFHGTLAEATGNSIFAIVLAPIQELLIESRRKTLGRDGAGVAYAHHERILDAVRRKDADAAEQAMRDHIAKIAVGNTFPDAPAVAVPESELPTEQAG
jgi:DNA-binding FadR family transcriptional regulator